MALTTMLNGGGNTIQNPSVAFTTPQNYASRLSHLLTVNAFKPLWCPTLTIQPTPSTFSPYLSPHSLDPFSAIAFTSRTAIQSFHQAISSLSHPPLSPDGPTFTVAALGKDSELLREGFLSRICAGSDRVKVLVPPVATPSSLAAELGDGGGRRAMCPVPFVVGLEEPPVVPSFLQELRDGGWVPVRVEAYETRWSGPRCAEGIVKAVEEKGLDAVVFTSSAEVEGLLKSLNVFGMGFGDLRRKCPGLVVAAHGPVTAAGAERLGVEVDVMCHKHGVMHRDLKPENFLFADKKETSSLKVIDFGLSIFFKPGERFNEIVGSPYYMAPEVLKRNYGPEIDIWSAGVILYILLSGVNPFWAETEQGVAQAILRSFIDFTRVPWPKVSDNAKDLVKKMLDPDPKRRLTAQEVLDHPWLQNAKKSS